jgi:hypothetical protein
LARGIGGTRIPVISGKDTLRRISEDLVEAGLQKHSKGFAREVFLELAELVRNYGRKINGFPQLGDELLEDSALLGLSVLRASAKSGDVRSALKLVDLRPNKEPIEHRVQFMPPDELESEGIRIFLSAGHTETEARALFEKMVLGAAALPTDTEDEDDETEEE